MSTNEAMNTGAQAAPGMNPAQAAPGVNPDQVAPGMNPAQAAPGMNPAQAAPGMNPAQAAPANPLMQNLMAQQEQQPASAETSKLAIASLVLGLLGTGIPAVICGHMARGRVNASRGQLKGAGMALAGLILGYLVIAFIMLAIAAAVLIPNVV